MSRRIAFFTPLSIWTTQNDSKYLTQFMRNIFLVIHKARDVGDMRSVFQDIMLYYGSRKQNGNDYALLLKLQSLFAVMKTIVECEANMESEKLTRNAIQYVDDYLLPTLSLEQKSKISEDNKSDRIQSYVGSICAQINYLLEQMATQIPGVLKNKNTEVGLEEKVNSALSVVINEKVVELMAQAYGVPLRSLNSSAEFGSSENISDVESERDVHFQLQEQAHSSVDSVNSARQYFSMLWRQWCDMSTLKKIGTVFGIFIGISLVVIGAFFIPQSLTVTLPLIGEILAGTVAMVVGVLVTAASVFTIIGGLLKLKKEVSDSSDSRVRPCLFNSLFGLFAAKKQADSSGACLELHGTK